MEEVLKIVQKLSGVFLSGFHERHDAWRGDRMDLGGITEAADQVVQPLAVNRGCRRKHEYARMFRFGVIYCRFDRRLHTDDDEFRILRAEPVSRGRGRCVAGDDDGLAAMCQKELNIGIRHLTDTRLRLIAVGRVDAVPKEYIIFVRHIVTEDPKDGDPTDTRIENADRRV